MKQKFALILIILGCFLLFKGGEIMALELKSSAFGNNAFIPEEYTCKGKDVSPPLSWSGVPEGTKSFALICDDPDAPMGTWVHWVIYNISPEAKNLPEAVKTQGTLEDGSFQGVNDAGRIGYHGPCPPPGAPHRYFFKLYALDTLLNLNSGLTKAELLQAIEGHIIDQTQLMGKFKR